MKKIAAIIISSIILLTLMRKARVFNYTHSDAPVYICNEYERSIDSIDSLLTVVSFNIKNAAKIDEAIELISSDTLLASADIILLQEMDEYGTQAIADELQYNYIYYPINRGADQRHFGNSILTKDSILSTKLRVLPHGQSHNNRMRGVTLASINYAGKSLLLASAHLSTVLLPAKKRKAQVSALADILDNELIQYDHAIVGGDFNAISKRYRNFIVSELGRVGLDASTLGLGSTQSSVFPFVNPELDMILSKDLHMYDSGKILDLTASDHYPIYAQYNIDTEGTSRS